MSQHRNWQVSATMNAFPSDWLKFSAVIPNVLLSLTFQANFFPIYKGMKNSNDHRITSACLTAIVTCGSVYLVVSLYAYMLYGDTLKANFLLCLDKQHTDPLLYYGMNLGFLLSVLFAYPIMFFSARNNFIAIVKLFVAYYQ
jgi:amino acid permease